MDGGHDEDIMLAFTMTIIHKSEVFYIHTIMSTTPSCQPYHHVFNPSSCQPHHHVNHIIMSTTP